MTLISAQDITFAQQGKKILDSISLELKAKQIVTLIGPNGAGKTTLLRLLLGLERPTSGRIERKNGLKIGYMPQKLNHDHSLPLSVRAFLQLSGKKNVAQLEQVLTEVHALHLIDQPLAKLSGGETQRILFANAMLQNPDLLVLDEPTQGIDLQGQQLFYRLLEHYHQQQGCGVLLVSHDLNWVMAATDWVICLNKHICCAGHPNDIKEDPAYHSLFGQALPQLKLYQHHHDHSHFDE